MRITKEASEAGYAVAKSVYDGTITKTVGINRLQDQFSLNAASAADFISNLASMLKGQKYARTNNVYTTSYFLEMIYKDFGLDSLNKALSALSKHLDYYKSVKSDLPSLRGILAKYRTFAKEQNATLEIMDDAIVDALETYQAKGQGFQLNTKLRIALEKYAMDAAKRYFASENYDVTDHSKGHPYDLVCRRGNEVLYIEVKGTRSSGEEIILTIGEVEFARTHKGQMALFIVHSILVSGEGGAFVLSEGQENMLLPWDVDKGSLKPMAFMYAVPSQAN
jgi:hypothetical protein